MRSGEIQLKCGLLALGLLVGFPGLARADVKFNFNTIDVPLCPLLPNALCPRTAVNGNGNNAIVGEFDDTAGNTHGFVLRGGCLHADRRARCNLGMFYTGTPGTMLHHRQWHQREWPACRNLPRSSRSIPCLLL